VFYVKDIFGLKIENERKLAQLREALLAALADPESTSEQTEATVAQTAGGRRIA
jgi:[protein-PII] uridylyltransferase